MRKFWLSGTTIILGVALLMAQPHHRGMNRYGGRHGMFGHKNLESRILSGEMKKKLGLTDKQISSIKKLIVTNEKNTIKMEADLKLAELDLRQIMDSENINKSNVSSALDKISSIRNKIHKGKLFLFVDIQKVLTKDQRKKIKEFAPHNRFNHHNKRMIKGGRGKISGCGEHPKGE